MSEDQSSLKDRRLEERAIREGWLIPQDKKYQILDRVIDRALKASRARTVIAAARVLTLTDLRQQRLDFEREKFAWEKQAKPTSSS